MAKLSLPQPLQLFVSPTIEEDERLELHAYLSPLFSEPVEIEVDTPSEWLKSFAAPTNPPHTWLGFLSQEDLNNPEIQALLKHVKHQNVLSHCALYSKTNFEDALREAQQFGIHTIVNPARPEFLQIVLFWLAFQHSLPVETILSSSLVNHTITSTKELQQCFFAIQNDCKQHQINDLEGFSTALMEAMTNAVYHAPRNSKGEEIYIKGSSIEYLPPEHHVTVQSGLTESGYLVRIHDQCGTLTASDVMYWLNRNMSGEGLFDSHGRGLFLMQQLTDQVIVAINPQQSSDIFLLKHTNSESPTGTASPLYLFAKPENAQKKSEAKAI